MVQTFVFLASSFWLGAVHAATPGHGKTIAAAYIVGARGRPVDALVLGIFVTLSHTSGIVLVAVLASLGSTWLIPHRIEAYLALATGLLVIGIGIWMLVTQRAALRSMRRGAGGPALEPVGAGREDSHDAGQEPSQGGGLVHSHGVEHEHTHLHGHSLETAHSHPTESDLHAHGVDPEPGHHEHTHAHSHPQSHPGGSTPPGHQEEGELGYHRHGWGVLHTHRLEAIAAAPPKLAVLLGLGIAGGLLPDPGALAILLAAIASGRVILGLFTVLVFSIGFASVLVVVGIVAARVGRVVLTWLEARWVTWVQVAAALVIVAVGIVLTIAAWRTLAQLS